MERYAWGERLWEERRLELELYDQEQAERRETEEAGEGERHEWERQEGEPALWHKRFRLYLGMGPTRTLAAAFREEYAVKHHGKEPKQAPASNWKTMATRWQWRARAEAFDKVQEQAAAGALRAKYVEMQKLRLDMSAELLLRARDVLLRAHLEELSEEQARALVPEVRLTVRDMAALQQREHALLPPPPPREEDEPPITADDLRDAWRKMEREHEAAAARFEAREEAARTAAAEAETAAGPQGDWGQWGRVEIGGRPASDGRHEGKAGQYLLICEGARGERELGDEARRRLRKEAGVECERLLDATRVRLKGRLNLQRKLRAGARYVQIGLPAAAEGVTCGDGLVEGLAEGMALSKWLTHVAVLLASDFRGDAGGAWLRAPGFAVLLREGMPPEEAQVLIEEFWGAIGRGRAPRAALAEATALCSEAAREYIAAVA